MATLQCFTQEASFGDSEGADPRSPISANPEETALLFTCTLASRGDRKDTGDGNADKYQAALL